MITAGEDRKGRWGSDNCHTVSLPKTSVDQEDTDKYMVKQTIHRVNSAAYLIGDDTDERGL
jgi:hypothetical protein